MSAEQDDPPARSDDDTTDLRTDSANVVVPPPVALALAIAAGLLGRWLEPLPWLPEDWPRLWLGAILIASGLALAGWAAATFHRGGTNVPTHRPTITIVTHGPYGFSRNPIYVGMFLLMAGLAIAVNSFWLIVALIGFAALIRHGVVAREEAYLERKFGRAYLTYKERVRRWI